MTEFFNIDNKILSIAEQATAATADIFAQIDETTAFNQNKVLKAFIDNRVSEACFAGSTGYGYGDIGRETLEAVFSQITGAANSIIRASFLSGTSTISASLFGILRPNDVILCVTGKPYDTLLGVIGINECDGSLKSFGIRYEQVDLQNGDIDYKAIKQRLEKSFVKTVYIQRSRGYSARKSLTVEEIEKIVRLTKTVSANTIVTVDNCYGEFVQRFEPTDVGADLIIGSLIKNAGGGIAKSGGYIAGRADLVEMCAGMHTAPGIGKEIGATLGSNRDLFMGLFNAPHAVGEALKTAVFAAAVFAQLGFEVSPDASGTRADIVQTITFGSEQGLTAFCRGLQKGMPVDAYVMPEAWDMPGYSDKVVMACGSFTSGATMELSADGPLRAPYSAWMQGGLNFHSAKTAIMLSIQSMRDFGVEMRL